MFLTRMPVPVWVDHQPAFLMRSMMWFPLIGALVGAWGAACLAPPLTPFVLLVPTLQV